MVLLGVLGALAALTFGVVAAVAASGPTVSSFSLVGASPTNAASVSWKVVFSESVTGVASSDFKAVSGGGLGGSAAVTGVSGSGTTWTVSASTGSGSGTLGLNLTAAGSIKDSSNHALQGTLPVVGPPITIDRTAPTVVSISRQAGAKNPTNAGPLVWTVTFSEPVDNVVAGDFGLVKSGVFGTAPSITGLSGSGAVYTVTIGTTATTGTDGGSIGLNLTSKGSIQDLAGNGLAGSTPVTGQAFTFDTEAPPSPVITGEPANPTASTSASFTVCDDSDNDGDTGCGDSDDVAGVVLWCSLDGSTPVVCTSPVPYTGLGTGSHTFKVYAVVLAGNVSGTTSYTWVIGKASPTVSTSLSPSSIAIGSSTHDTATLSGATASAGGSLTYSYYTNSSCTTGAVSLTPVTVTNHLVPNSSSVTFTAPGTYYWQAAYTGDANNNSAHSTCTSEQLTVTKAHPAISTSASGPVTVGQPITDPAKLTGAYGTPVKGTVTFNVYRVTDSDNDGDGGNPDSDDYNCNTPLNATPIATVSTGTSGGNPTYTSAPFIPANAGTYTWVASFAGDGNNSAVAGTCGAPGETTVVNKAQPALSTSATSSVTVGGTVSDTATLTGLVSPDGSGFVLFGLFSNSHCLGLPLYVSFSTGVAANGSVGSGNYTTTAANPSGDYWAAIYTGDSNNLPVVEGCGATGETSTVNQATPKITTIPSAGLSVGGKVSDSATITSGYSLNGQNIKFTLYSNSACTTSVFSSTNTISSGGAISGSYTTTAAGIYYWKASYAGDSNNASFTTTCGGAGDEKVVVTSGSQPLTISGNASGPLYPLSPSGPTTGIPVKFTNLNNVPVTVTTLTITASGYPGSCSPDLLISVGNISATHPVTVPANGSVTLPDPVNAPGVTEPTILMQDSGDQSTCTGSFALNYAGTNTGSAAFGSQMPFTVALGAATGGLLWPTAMNSLHKVVDTIQVTVTNASGGFENLRQLTYEVTPGWTRTVGGNPPCTASDFSIDGLAVNTADTVVYSQDIAPGGHVTHSFTIQMIDNGLSQGSCEGTNPSLTAVAS